MANPNLLDSDVRAEIIKSINGDENNSRKRESQRRFDVYNDRQDRYILEKLRAEFSKKTVDDMRKLLSVNLCKKVVTASSSIYVNEPTRNFEGATDKEIENITALYDSAKVNQRMRLANRYVKLQNQISLMVLPSGGKVDVRPLLPHQFDVIPDNETNPENAFCYILSVWDFDNNKTATSKGDGNRYQTNDNINQPIADDNDRDPLLERYIFWTADEFFTVDGNGAYIVDPQPNPINQLPFIDVPLGDKDFQFFIRRGQSVVDFSLDFGLMLSDLVNTNRLQSYAQALIYSEKQPQNMVIGPNHILWLQLDPNRPDVKPSFEFVSPNPDLKGSLEILESIVKFFLSAQGIDTSTIVGSGDSRTYTSGVDRLLAMVDQFTASKEDLDLFRSVESDVFNLIRAWSNELQGTDKLNAKLQNGQISDGVELTVKFSEPAMVKTPKEKEESALRRIEAGLMSRVEAIAELREVGKDEAEKIIKEIDEGLLGGSAEI